MNPTATILRIDEAITNAKAAIQERVIYDLTGVQDLRKRVRQCTQEQIANRSAECPLK